MRNNKYNKDLSEKLFKNIKMDIDKLVNDFITKVNFKFKNGDIIDNKKEYFSIYTNVTQERTLVINKNIEKNNVNILKNVLKTHKIKPKSYLKKD
jgi:hypothetical protein